MRRDRRLVRPAQRDAARRSCRLRFAFDPLDAPMAAGAHAGGALVRARHLSRRRRRRASAAPIVAELQGRRTALAVLEDLGRAVDAAETARLDRRLARQARFRQRARARLSVSGPPPRRLSPTSEIVCRCEGISVGALRDAALTKDAREMNRLKALTRIGMGRCQGRVCGHAAAELLARACGVDIESVGRLRGQPPVKPIPILGGAAVTRASARRRRDRRRRHRRLRRRGRAAAGGAHGRAAGEGPLRRRRERRQLRRRAPAGPPSRRAAAGAPGAPALGSDCARRVGEDVEFEATGHIKLARSEADMAELERYARDAAEYGLRLQLLGANAARAELPWLGETVVGASLCAEDGQANPRLVGPAYARLARRLGADVREHAAVIAAERTAAGFETRTENLVVTSRFLVNCAGIGAGRIAALVRRGRTARAAGAEHARDASRRPSSSAARSAFAAATSMCARSPAATSSSAAAAAGATRSSTRSRPVTGAVARRQWRGPSTSSRPSRGAHVIRTWTGIDGEMPDDIPVIGHSATTPNLDPRLRLLGAWLPARTRHRRDHRRARHRRPLVLAARALRDRPLRGLDGHAGASGPGVSSIEPAEKLLGRCARSVTMAAKPGTLFEQEPARGTRRMRPFLLAAAAAFVARRRRQAAADDAERRHVGGGREPARPAPRDDDAGQAADRLGVQRPRALQARLGEPRGARARPRRALGELARQDRPGPSICARASSSTATTAS